MSGEKPTIKSLSNEKTCQFFPNNKVIVKWEYMPVISFEYVQKWNVVVYSFSTRLTEESYDISPWLDKKKKFQLKLFDITVTLKYPQSLKVVEQVKLNK